MKCFPVLAAMSLLTACGVPSGEASPPPPLPADIGPPIPLPSGGKAQVPGLRFSVEPATAAPGATVTLVLRNGSPRQLGYNLCMSGLEQRQGNGWRPVVGTAVCTAELRLLTPGQEARFQRRLPPTLATGEYRFGTRVETPLNSSPQSPIFSESFYVGR